MKFTDLFVRRPVLALVISILILMLGVVAILQLPIRQYPMLESSTITVSTTYPGASAELMQGFVTQPIAQAVSSVEGIDYLTSSSVQGSSTVTVRMELNRDSTQALTEVMAKVNQVRYKLPEGAFDPVIERSAGDSSAVAYVGFASESVSAPALTDYLARVVQPMFATIDGVAKVDVYGGQQLAMRLWIDPAKLAARGLTAADVADAVRRNNYQAAPGKVKGQFVVSNISVNTDLTSVEQFRDMVITKGGDAKDSAALVRLKDVGAVELGAAATETSGIMDGVPAVYLGLSPTPGGNPLVIVDGIKKLLPEIQKTLPPGVKVELAFETARFIQSSIDEVAHTLLEALLIVVIVIYLCMGSLRSVLIPVVTIPLSMLGAAALMLAFGFSINLLTLLAMVLAVGLVVDDAIVVVENVHRHIEEGKTPVAAALVGAREVAGPVIAMTITLAAVYAPIGMMGGLTGALFKEFALTLAGAVVVSGVVALTLSPVMSSLLLQPKQAEGRMARAAEHFFEGLTSRYARLLDRSLQHRWLSAGFAALVMVSLPFLYLLPQRELAPAEDQASVLTAIKAPQHANLDYVERFSYKLDDIYKRIPETASRWIINGGEGPASSIGGINLTPWAERTRNAAVIQAELQHAVGDVEGTSIFAFQLAPLPGSSGGLPVQMVLRSAQDYATLFRTMEDVKQRARASGLFAVVDSDLDYNNPVVKVQVDRSKANSLGIRMQDIGESLAVLVGENYLNRFGMDGRAYDVIAQSPREQRLTAHALTQQYVRADDGSLLPLSAVVSVSEAVEPNMLTQFNQQNAATFQGVPAPGVTLGDAVAFLDGVAKTLPPGFSYDWQSDARQFATEGNALLLAFLAAVVVIYLVLAAQYESLTDPLIILITVPLSICGALIPLALGYATVNIYTQIGLVTLIGLISKHGILMVEFANELQLHERLDRITAIRKAAQIRLRPILMTTAAMVVGLVPLLFASGAGANSRFGLGVVIVSGMVIGTFFTLFVLPTVYTFLARRHTADHATPRARPVASAEGIRMKNYRYLISLFPVLAGCAVTPAYVTPGTPDVHLASPQQAQFAPAASAVSEAAWWTFFDDARLSQLIAGALEHNLDIAQAQANLLAARAVVDERRLDELPAVTGQAGWQRSVEQDTPDSRAASAQTRVGFDAQWEIDLFGRLAHMRRSAQARAEAAQADLRQVQLTIAAEVARNYYEALGYQQDLALTQAQVQSWRDTVALIDARIRAGSGLPEERHNALANLARSEAAIPPLQAGLRQAQYRLDVLSGQAPGAIALATMPRQQAPLAGQLPLGDVNRLIRQRPDVVRAERLLAASSEDVGAARADLYPRLSLGGFLGFFALRGSGVFDGGARAFEVAPSATYPAFRLGSVKARLRGTQAGAQGAQARYAQTLLVAQEEVENAVTQLAENQARLASLLQSARHGNAALDIASTRYAGGAGSYQAVLENQRALFAIRRAALQSETASYIDAIALYKALGWGHTM